MSIFNKIKNILFEEEEVEIPTITKEETVSPKEEKKESIDKPQVPDTPKNELPKRKEEIKQPVEEVKEEIEIVERDIYKTPKTFEFPVFDEEEFSNTSSRITRSSNNALEQAKKQKRDSLNYGRYEEKKEVQEVKKFTPSPVISPVYGVIDVEVKRENVVPRTTTVNDSSSKSRKIDFETVRKKAYGTLEDEIESIIPEKEDINVMNTIVEEETSEIDDLLMNTATEKITIGELDKFEDTEDVDLDDILNSSKKEEMSDALNVLESIENDLEQTRTQIETLENNTLENDLFNLIDSMYDTKEEEE